MPEEEDTDQENPGNPDLEGIKNTDLTTIMNLKKNEFRIWSFFQFQNINRRLNWQTYLLLIILGSILGTRLI